MYYTYIIKNLKGDYYKGHTESLDQRIKDHNSGKTKSIKNRGPWVLFYHEEYETREESILRECYFKSGGGRRFIKKLEKRCESGESPELPNGLFKKSPK